MDLITFIVPAYNAEKTLCKTVDSILNQTDSRCQIILVNDGSVDKTGNICEFYQSKHPHKIVYIKQENKGLGGARNSGMKYVDTPYVAFLDSDDWLMPDYVENILIQLEQNRDMKIEMIMTLPQIYHEKSKTIMDWHDKQLFYQVFQRDGQIVNPKYDERLYYFEVNQCRKILSMEFVKKIGFCFREKIKWEDIYPHIYLISKCTSCMGIKSVGFYYRVGQKGQITASTGVERLDLLQVFDDVIKYVQSKEDTSLYGYVMVILVRFSIWHISMSEDKSRKLCDINELSETNFVSIRKILIKELHKRFVSLPACYYKALLKELKENKNLKKAEARRIFLFAAAIKNPIGCFLLSDYLYQEIGEKILKNLFYPFCH